ncbi:G-protein coupled receptor Mth2-like isoform X9 [Diabrotica virgifera virgifera]|uniref:G-protein coupled receptor Mth2-like n=1 Tax=Diabrotica virgifera virgifera TaxID=50390 RepID=A0ABM5KWW5_DIAVI|nr:G-protein coupled receptor Mth2-like isoform X9 [Diabrotica virgifera virgifera]
MTIKITLIIYLINLCYFSDGQPCPMYLAVNITDGVKENDVIKKDGLNYNVTDYMEVGHEVWGCVCHIKTCLRKCCDRDQRLVGDNCEQGPLSDFRIPIFNLMTKISEKKLDDFHVVYGRQCPDGYIMAKSDLDIFVQSNGTVYYAEDYYENIYDIENYCVENFSGGFSALLCEEDIPEPKEARVVKGNGMIISMPFLLLTFLVYLLLPERNLHRRALMSYVFTLLAAYITLVTIQLYSGQFPDTTCHVLGYLIIFFFLVSFFWMNVMCVDMWLAFSGMRTFLSKKTAERKRFIIYCIYAWGMPIVHVLIVFLINHYGSTDTSWNPQIGVKRCFLGEGMPTFYYFYLPMAILIGINITLFVLTTVRIQKIKKETSMLKQTDSRRHTYEDDKQKFNLYLKLMFAMGVNWITELVSWAVDYAFSETPAYVWYITDFTNAMYGVLIFLIFVFKKKIWRSLKKKYYICIGKPHLAHSMTTSSARGTRTSNYSTTDTTAVSTDYRLSDMKNGKIPEESALNRT